MNTISNSLFLDKKNNRVFLFPFLIFILNFVIKIVYINSRDIALDEPFTIYYAQTNISTIIDMLYNENNPPFHFLFLHFWIKLFGIGAFSVRLPSLIFSSLTAVVIYKIGNKFFNSLTGIAAALIFTFSTMQLFFAHEARVYSLFVLLTSLSLYYYLKIAEHPKFKSNYFALFIFNLILIYSHYFGFFVIFIEMLCLIYLPNRKELIKPFLILFLALALSYIPNLFIFWHRFSTSTQNGTWVSAPAITELYGNLNRFINSKYNMVVLIIISMMIVVSLLIKKKLNREIKLLVSDQKYIVILFWFIIPYSLMFLLSFKTPMFIDRYILYTSIPFYLLIAISIIKLIKKLKFQLIAITVFIASMIINVQLDPDNNRRLKEVIGVVKNLKKENTITILAPDYAYMGFAYHYNPVYFKNAPNTIADLNTDLVFPVNNIEQVEKILKGRTDDCLYIQAGTEFLDPKNLIYSTIASKFKYHKEFKVFEIYSIHQFYN